MSRLLAGHVRILIGCGVLALLGLAAWLWLAGTLTSGTTAKVRARLDGGRADAALASASDTANTIASGAASEAAIDAITLENDRAILNAAGAAAPVDPAVDAAGLRGLCQRSAYRGSQRCMQFTPAR